MPISPSLTMYRLVDSSQREIRLLSLEPAAGPEAALVGRLHHDRLSSNPEYDAVSYAWGTDANAKDITIDGQAFRVRENCAAALKRLRLPSGRRTLWIDAICINQKDEDEKSGQVNMMREIYEKAKQVCVWLGEMRDADHTVLSNVLRAEKPGHVGRSDLSFSLSPRNGLWTGIWAGRFKKKSRLISHLSATSLHDLFLTDELRYGEVRELLSRPWWTRAWIIQEVVVAKKLEFFCGKASFDLATIQSLIDACYPPSGFGESLYKRMPPEQLELYARFRSIERLRRAWAKSERIINIPGLLYEFRSQQCQDPRDKIYAFLGMANARQEYKIRSHYGQTRAGDIYISVAKNLMERTGSLDILNFKREWKGIQKPAQPVVAFNVFDQAKYHDTEASVVHGASKETSRGWLRLPPGWERIDNGDRCFFVDHNSGREWPDSPFKSQYPLPAEDQSEYRVCPEGWVKTWDNLGRVDISYRPDKKAKQSSQTARAAAWDDDLGNLPSWVPNWDAATHMDPPPLLGLHDDTRTYYNASGATQPVFGGSGDDRALVLGGLLFDEVATLARPWRPANNVSPTHRDTGDVRESWDTLALEEVAKCPYESREEALWRTLIADRAGTEAAPASTSELVRIWRDRDGRLRDTPNIDKTAKWGTFLHQVLRDTGRYASEAYTSFGSPDAGADWDQLAEITERINRACAHRALFVTKAGYIGLAPWNAKVGDSVCVLAGGKTPYLLRAEGTEGAEQYSLVGETYVYGIMDGQVAPEGTVERYFRIV